MTPRQRSQQFCDRFGLRCPLLMAPMAGVTGHALPSAVAAAGGMAALGALMLNAAAIGEWIDRFKEAGGGPLQVNLWMPDPPPPRDLVSEARVRQFLADFGPSVPPEAADTPLQDLGAQFEAVLAARPAVFSTIMGLPDADRVRRLKAAGIAWFANVTTVGEARAAEAAGADVIVAQGAEAGGHRGRFEAAQAQRDAVGLFALLPQVVDAVRTPVVATGGIADARGVAAALLLGASAVQIGTGLLRTPEAGIHPAWAQALGRHAPEDTQLTRAFSGRWGRALATGYVRAAAAPGAPEPAPYPLQRGMTAAMRQVAEREGDLQRMQAWAGQAAALAPARPAADWLSECWQSAQALLPH